MVIHERRKNENNYAGETERGGSAGGADVPATEGPVDAVRRASSQNQWLKLFLVLYL